ncbi:allophanate hydrolase [Virgisporangium aurantiacum]|uniref:Allophanate hydrolase n=1 Tax=Virgisporangium aurantiacum TaxID=175570 RepID=A0A8J3YVY2_9ACTN|nr:allophanate hydrolase [Virgisporangium aurantiacum]
MVGRTAVLLEVGGHDEVAAWYAELVRQRAEGRISAVDIVPAARTVLIDGVPDPHKMLESLQNAPDPATSRRDKGALITVPTVYDGLDLADIAERWNTTPAGVVERHQEIEFEVAFCGFAPGFAYLTGLPPELRVPRLGEPRVSVPRGSVALADEYAAVYPAASPGGWRLLGRTDLVLFDLDRDPPSLFQPGTRVRFEAK